MKTKRLMALLLTVSILLTSFAPAFASYYDPYYEPYHDIYIEGFDDEVDYPTLVSVGPGSLRGSVYTESGNEISNINCNIFRLKPGGSIFSSSGDTTAWEHVYAAPVVYSAEMNASYSWSADLSGVSYTTGEDYRIEVSASDGTTAFSNSAYFSIRDEVPGVEVIRMTLVNSDGTLVGEADSRWNNSYSTVPMSSIDYGSTVSAVVYAYSDYNATIVNTAVNDSFELTLLDDDFFTSLGTVQFVNGVATVNLQAGTDVHNGDELIATLGTVRAAMEVRVWTVEGLEMVLSSPSYSTIISSSDYWETTFNAVYGETVSGTITRFSDIENRIIDTSYNGAQNLEITYMSSEGPGHTKQLNFENGVAQFTLLAGIDFKNDDFIFFEDGLNSIEIETWVNMPPTGGGDTNGGSGGGYTGGGESPDPLYADLEVGFKEVVIEWQNYQPDMTENTSYVVYRSAGTYFDLNTATPVFQMNIPSSTQTTYLRWTDTGVDDGGTYTYKVMATAASNGQLISKAESGVLLAEIPVISVTGTILFPDGITPAQDSEIEFFDANDQYVMSLYTEDGTFDAALAPGNYNFEVFNSQYAPYEGTITVTENGVTNISVTLKPYNVTGTVYASDGISPMSGSWVTILQNNDFLDDQPTDYDGRFNFALEPGDYTIEVQPDSFSGLAPVYVPITVYAGDLIIDKAIVLQTANANTESTVSGMVYNWFGNRVSGGGEVWLKATGTSEQYPIYTWMYDGQFDFEGVQPGTYSLGITKDNQTLEIGTVTIEMLSGMDVVVTGFSGGITIENGKLKVTLPEPRVKGRLLKGNIPQGRAGLDIKQIDTGSTSSTSATGDAYYYWIMTDSEGYFGIDLQDGDYTIERAYLPEANDYLTPVFLDKQFNVPTDTASVMNVVIPESNVKGEIGGLAAPQSTAATNDVIVTFTSEKTDSTGTFYAETRDAFAKWDSAKGKYVFENYLPAGRYRVGLVNENKWVDLSGEFLNVSGSENSWTISTDTGNSLITVDSNNYVTLRIPQPNVTGSIRDSKGIALAEAGISIRDSSAPDYDWSAYRWVQSDSLGNFSLFLPDGNYEVTEIVLPDGTSERISYDFSVSGGVLTQPLDIILAESNITGTVFESDGITPVRDMPWIEIRSADTAQNEPYKERWFQVDKDGNFSISLKPGMYDIYGISTSIEWVSLTGKTFSVNDSYNLVNDGNLAVNNQIRLVLPGKNVRGVLTRGGVPLADAWLTIRDQNPNTTEGTATGMNDHWVRTDASGRFGLNLNPGTYFIDGISTQQGEWIPWQQEFMAPADNLAVNIPAENLKGRVLDENGLPVQDSWVTVAPAAVIDTNGSINDYSNVRWLQTDSQGNFTGTLMPDTYKVTSISTSTRWIELPGPQFTVTNSTVETIEVQIPGPNVNGVLRDENGNLIANAWIEIMPEAISEGSYEVSKWTSTDADGKFSLILDDGGTNKNYVVTGISYNSPSGNKWVQMHQAFTVLAGKLTTLAVKIPGMNVRGRVYTNTNKDQVIPYAWVAVTRAGAASDDWSATQWTGADENGSFSLSLSPGAYNVTGVSSNKGWVQFTGEQFSVTDTDVANIDVIIPSPNITGTVFKASGEVLPNAYLEIKPAGAADDDYNKLRWVNADELGRFEMILDPGNYIIKNIGYNEGQVEVNQEFTATSTVSNLEVRIPTPNVVGSLTGAGFGNEAWLSVQPANVPADDWSKTKWTTTKDGAFGFVLSPGEYRFVGYYNNQGWVDLNYTFTVTEGSTIDVGTINQSDLKISGTVTINGSAAANATVGIKPEGKNTRWITTDANGNYELAAFDGVYTITYVVTETEWLAVNSSLTVSGQSLTQNIDLTL